jgi:hypothetical protein
MVYAVSDFGCVIVAILAADPIIFNMQNMVKKIQPDAFVAPCRAATKMLHNKQGV